MLIRPTRVTVDLAAVRHNLGVARQLSGHAVCAVVKADAYGHGAVAVAKTLAGAGVEFLAVALVEEGLELRDAGVKAPIIVLGGAYRGAFEPMLAADLVPALSSTAAIDELARVAGSRRALFHLKIDSGMARLGVQPADIPEVAAALSRHRNLVLEGALTHFANADLGDRDFNTAQHARFQSACEQLSALGHPPRFIHIANSAAVLSFPAAHHRLVRPGLMLYGLDPLSAPSGAALRPALRWSTEPVHVKTLPKGTRVSYGGRWTTERASRIATLPVGYADGYPRNLTGKAQVLIRGKRVPVVGTICMDLMMIDVTDVPDATETDEVVLLGEQGAERITAGEMARWADTISYEIICGIGKRVPRRYVNA
jgi:alanine racemase